MLLCDVPDQLRDDDGLAHTGSAVRANLAAPLEWGDQVKKGVEHWDGVRNYQANNNMKAMKSGDKGFFYHSVKEKAIVGIVEVVKEHYPDHTDGSGRFGMVDIKALHPVKNPVKLADVKAEPTLENFALVKPSLIFKF
mgnify:CR=1 FL=1